MTSEYRIIEFDHIELASALAAHTIAQGRQVVAGTPKTLTIDVEKIVIVAVWAPTKKRPEARISYEHDEVCQALIRHCRTIKIPLPASSKKTISVLNGHISMLIEVLRPPTSPLIPLEYAPAAVSSDRT